MTHDSLSEPFVATSTPAGRPTSSQGAGWDLVPEEADLRSSLVALSMVATGRLGLEDLLTEVATFAVLAIPNADGAGLTLLDDNRSDTIVTTASFVREVDDIQYSLGQGPCISAAADGQTIVSGSLGRDPRWPTFGGRVARLGVHSALSLPLITSGGVIGAINVYAHTKDAFDERAAALGELFAVPAATAVETAQILAQARRLTAQLQAALETRSVIERAIGIIISRTGITGDEALERLRTLSQREHHKLTTVARTLVDEAASRARARHIADQPTTH